MAKDTPPRWDRKMQQRLARGEAAALGELYDRFASLVHGLAHRVLGRRDAADRITREVFAYIWENPDAYDPKQGPMRSWVAAITQRLAGRRLRRRHREDGTALPRSSTEQLEEKVRAASVAARADYIVTSMPAPLRAALELAYFQRRDYRQTAGTWASPRTRPGAGSGWASSCCPPATTPAAAGAAPRRPWTLPMSGPHGQIPGEPSEPGESGEPGGPDQSGGDSGIPGRGDPGGTGPTATVPDRPRIPPPRVPADDSTLRPGLSVPADAPAPYERLRAAVRRSARPAPVRPARPPGAEVAARRLGAGRLLRRGDGGRRGAPQRLRRLRGRGAAAARRGRAAAPRGEPRPRPACCAPASWRAAWAGARRVSRCPTGRRRTTRRPPGSTRCCGTSATRSGTRPCGCAGSRASGRRAARRRSPGSSRHLLAVDGLVATALGLADPLGTAGAATPRSARPGHAHRGVLARGSHVPPHPRRPRAVAGAEPRPGPYGVLRRPRRRRTRRLVRRLRAAAARRPAGPRLRVLGARRATSRRRWTIRTSRRRPRICTAMVDLAARLLPGALADAAGPGSPRRPGGWSRPARRAVALHLEVEGTGGGDWFIPLDSPAAAAPPDHAVAQSPWTASSSASWPRATFRRRRRRRARTATGRRSGTCCSRRRRCRRM